MNSHVRPLSARPAIRRMLGDFMYVTQRDTIPTRKTPIYSVTNVRSGASLGTVQFYPAWRQYTFWPEPSTIFNTECLGLLKSFVDELNEGRKSGPR